MKWGIFLGLLISCLAIIFILSSFFFFSANITGNAIAGMELDTINLLGVGLFILGLLLLFMVRKLLL